jgi:ribosomal 30S subunit maturation factor RimM
MRRDIELLRLQRSEDNRRITGLEKTVERELEWRKDADFHYCEIVDCEIRKPPVGSFKRV